MLDLPSSADDLTHDPNDSIGVLYCNLGTPAAPTAQAVRRYLAQFLSDARVVDIPRWLWWPILHGVVLRTRPARSAAKYASIWTPQGSPLMVWTQAQAQGLQKSLRDALGSQAVHVRHAMRYGQPSIASQLDVLVQMRVRRILVLPAYPQYSTTTTASMMDTVQAWSAQQRGGPKWRFVNQYPDDAGYIAALTQRIEAHWQKHGRPSRLLMSFHGVPERTLKKGDPYHDQCQQTARLLARNLGLDKTTPYAVSFQSRFGKAKWLEPATNKVLAQWGQEGLERVDVVCPGFVTDCLETLEEIDIEGRETFVRAGGKAFHYIACLNDSPAWIQGLTQLALQHLQAWPEA